jgi:hypothetical protein
MENKQWEIMNVRFLFPLFMDMRENLTCFWMSFGTCQKLVYIEKSSGLFQTCWIQKTSGVI